MSQQINLYQPIFRKEKRVFSAVTILQAIGVVVLALLGIYAYGHWQVGRLESELARLEDQEAAGLQRLERLTGAGQRDSGEPSAAEQLQRTIEELEQRRQVLEILTGRGVGGTEGFSRQLTAFAQQRIEGLWLTGITVGGGGEQLQLQGNTTDPELLPQYLQSLAEEPAFEGTGFTSFSIRRPEKERGVVEFSIATAELDPSTTAGR